MKTFRMYHPFGIIRIGKYEGKTIAEIKISDPQYIQWAYTNEVDLLLSKYAKSRRFFAAMQKFAERED